MKKLIIWDFDGVIADTEQLWVRSKMDILNQKLGLDWDFETAARHLGGSSDKDKKRILQELGITISDNFWQEAGKLDIQAMLQGFPITPGIEEIFNLTQFEQCLGTGGTNYATAIKLKQTGVERYFPPQKVFTSDLVAYGKPQPDLFLLAAETMGYKPEDTFVIEDSVVGITAAIRAKMTPLAFVKYDLPFCVDEIKKMGVSHIFDDMAQIKEFLLKQI